MFGYLEVVCSKYSVIRRWPGDMAPSAQGVRVDVNYLIGKVRAVGLILLLIVLKFGNIFLMDNIVLFHSSQSYERCVKFHNNFISVK